MSDELPDDWWTTHDVATFLHVAPATVRAYLARHQMPDADRKMGRMSLWKPATVQQWHENRVRVHRDSGDGETQAASG